MVNGPRIINIPLVDTYYIYILTNYSEDEEQMKKKKPVGVWFSYSTYSRISTIWTNQTSVTTFHCDVVNFYRTKYVQLKDMLRR